MGYSPRPMAPPSSLNRRTLLIVDDDILVRRRLRTILEPHYFIEEADSAASAQIAVQKQPLDLVLLDLQLGQYRGADLLAGWKLKYPDLDIVVCSGESRVETAIQCVRNGAADFIPKPFRPEDVLWVISRVLEVRGLRNRVEKLGPLVHPHPVQLIGKSASLTELRKCMASLRGQTHLNIMILGESGTGKEVVARSLHQNEEDPNRPFVVVNMPAIPVNLVESELFGVQKGAFTDAKASRAGKFELADGGDIFLDEIGDLPAEVQPKLLRTLQEHVVERVGGQPNQRRIPFRVISATNQPLSLLMSTGRFREDLIYRLSDMVIWLAPLRERRDDIPALVEHFIQKYHRSPEPPQVASQAMDKLVQYSWPGNVRQLDSTIKRALIFNTGRVIDDIPIFDLTQFRSLGAPSASEPAAGLPDRYSTSRESLSRKRQSFESQLLSDTLRKHGGDRAAACRELGLSRATFYRKLSALRDQSQT